MRAINPRVDEALVRLAESVEADVDYLDRAGVDAWNALAVLENGEIRFPRQQFSELDRAVSGRLLILGAKSLRGTKATPSMAQLRDVETLLRTHRSGWSVSLPGDVRVDATGKFIRMTAGPPRATPTIPATPLDRGRSKIGTWRFEVALVNKPAVFSASRTEAYFDTRNIQGGLTVRSRRAGDRLRPLGLNGSRKVQDIFVDAKVAADERDGVPIVCDGAGILWVVGHCIDQRAAVAEECREVLRIKAERLITSAV
jgi:tRNA(Ile)-lysidine synthase